MFRYPVGTHADDPFAAQDNIICQQQPRPTPPKLVPGVFDEKPKEKKGYKKTVKTWGCQWCGRANLDEWLMCPGCGKSKH